MIAGGLVLVTSTVQDAQTYNAYDEERKTIIENGRKMKEKNYESQRGKKVVVCAPKTSRSQAFVGKIQRPAVYYILCIVSLSYGTAACRPCTFGRALAGHVYGY